MLLGARGARPTEAFAQMVGASEGNRPRVLVISAGTDTAAGPAAAADLRSTGTIATSIRITRTMAESNQIIALLTGVNAVWLTGSNPVELGAALGGTPTAQAIASRARSGLRVGGDGAGAGMIADALIAGGDMPPARRGRRAAQDEGVVTAEGLGILTGALVYAPTASNHKPDAIDSALALHPRLLGIQLDSGAALAVMSDGVWQSVGTSDVLIYVPDDTPPVGAEADTTATDSTTAAPAGPVFRARILSPGSRFDPRTRRLLPLTPAGTR